MHLVYVFIKYSFYCPQKNCGKVMFSEVSVILFTGFPMWRIPMMNRGMGTYPRAPHTLPPPLPPPHTHTLPPATDIWWPPPVQTCSLEDLPPPPVLTSSGGHRTGRYASYWNADLCNLIFVSWARFYSILHKNHPLLQKLPVVKNLNEIVK